jgi:ATP-dependent DNA ligase
MWWGKLNQNAALSSGRRRYGCQPCTSVAGVRLLTRRGLDWTKRYPSPPQSPHYPAGPVSSIGEVVICGEDGIPVFDRLRYGRQPKNEAGLTAFDLLRWQRPALLALRTASAPPACH